MLSALAGLAGDQARMMARHIAAPAISALVGTFFVLLAVAALFAALFLWLEQTHGPVVAALSVSLVAFALGLVALLPLLLRRRRPNTTAYLCDVRSGLHDSPENGLPSWTKADRDRGRRISARV